MSHSHICEAFALNYVGPLFFDLVVYESISRLVLEINQQKQKPWSRQAGAEHTQTAEECKDESM